MKKNIVITVLFCVSIVVYMALFSSSFVGIVECKYQFNETYTCNISEETLIHRRLHEMIYTSIIDIKMFKKKPGDCGPVYTIKLIDKENDEYTLEPDLYDNEDFDSLSKLFKGKRDFIYHSKSYKINFIAFCVAGFICLILLVFKIKYREHRYMKYRFVGLPDNSEKDFYNKEN